MHRMTKVVLLDLFRTTEVRLDLLWQERAPVLLAILVTLVRRYDAHPTGPMRFPSVSTSYGATAPEILRRRVRGDKRRSAP